MGSTAKVVGLGASQLVCEASVMKGALMIGRKSVEIPAWTRHWTTATAKLTEELYLSYGFRSLPSAQNWLNRAGPAKLVYSDMQKLFRKRLVRVLSPSPSPSPSPLSSTLPQQLPPRIGSTSKLTLGSSLLVRKDSLKQSVARYESLPVRKEAEKSGKGRAKANKSIAEALPIPKALCAWITKAVVFLDQNRDFVALNKPSGIACQSGTGVSVSVDRCSAILSAQVGGGRVPKLVHRLDKDSSGVLLLSTSDSFTRLVTRAFSHGDYMIEKIRKEEAMARGGKDSDSPHHAEHLLRWYRSHSDMVKVYWTVVKLNKNKLNMGLLNKAGLIDCSLRTDLPYRVKPRKAEEEKERERDHCKKYHQAMTFYRVLKQSKTRALLEVIPVTGKRHQIRAHLWHVLGCPIVGDAKYSSNSKGKYYQRALTAGKRGQEKLHLHCKHILCKLPTGKIVDVSADIPSHMEDTIGNL